MTEMNFITRWYFIFTVTVLFQLDCVWAVDCADRSSSSTILFSTKVEESPLIVVGTSLNKVLDPEVQNLFNVTFLVECILKGQPTQRFIQIVQAGSLLGRRSCQRLNPNRQYIVFLEPFFEGTYRPADFEEIAYSPQINPVLEKTCGLSRTYPYTEVNDTEGISTNRCPSGVSADCPSGCSIYTTKASVASTITTTISSSSSSRPVSNSRPSNSHPIMNNNPQATNVFTNPNLDLAALRQFLADYQNNNLSLAFLQAQNHKALFSDDDIRKNGISGLSMNFFFSIISPILFYCSS